MDWVAFLREAKGFGPDDPIFPKSRVAPDKDQKFALLGLERAHWANAQPVRAIFKAAFERVGLPYFNPHSLRNTLVQVAYDLKLGPEQFKAWSQNLGHEHVLTTFSSYGSIPAHRQAAIIRGLSQPASADEKTAQPETLKQIRKLLDQADKGSG